MSPILNVRFVEKKGDNNSDDHDNVTLMKQLHKCDQCILVQYNKHLTSSNGASPPVGAALMEAGAFVRSEQLVVCEVLRTLLSSDKHAQLLSSDLPIWLLDISRTRELVHAWHKALPRVRPFYAVKCNPHHLFLHTLACLGTGFDCASKDEIQKVLELGVPPGSIVFANTCKLESDMACAANCGIGLTTFDSVGELQKIYRYLENVDVAIGGPSKASFGLLLRIATDDKGSTIPLSSKYGALMEEVEALLQMAAQMGLSVVGVAFHIGSGASNPHAFDQAISNARRIFDLSKELLGCASQMRILDIGGGFCSSRPETKAGRRTGGGITLQQAAPIINRALRVHFPCLDDIEIIAEPGRYFATAPFTIVTRVFGKRVRGETREYWINDGAHHSFTMILLPHNTDVPLPIPFACASQPDNPACTGLPCFPANVYGPTCSALDMLLKGHPLQELEVGDLLAFPFMGAYTHALATHFNGFSVLAEGGPAATSNVVGFRCSSSSI